MNLPKHPKIAIAGAVNSSLKTLEKLIEHDCNICLVLALNPEKAKNVSGYRDLMVTANEHKLFSRYFNNINDEEVFVLLQEKKPDILFVIGLSQIVKRRILNLPKYGSIGYHPTKLPKGRGRGAIAWIILGKAPGAATFFLMDEGMDSGPILCQVAYEVTDNDYAQDVIEKVMMAIGEALDNLLPNINKGILVWKEQKTSEITFLGRRKPQDGLIDWSRDAREIHTLIRATSSPLPGAFTFYDRFLCNSFYELRKSCYLSYFDIPLNF